jgi:hypothetical protein
VEAEGCQFIALIEQRYDGGRRRVLLQAYAVDLAEFHDGQLAELFDKVTTHGWLWIGEIAS